MASWHEFAASCREFYLSVGTAFVFAGLPAHELILAPKAAGRIGNGPGVSAGHLLIASALLFQAVMGGAVAALLSWR